MTLQQSLESVDTTTENTCDESATFLPQDDTLKQDSNRYRLPPIGLEYRCRNENVGGIDNNRLNATAPLELSTPEDTEQLSPRKTLLRSFSTEIADYTASDVTITRTYRKQKGESIAGGQGILKFWLLTDESRETQFHAGTRHIPHIVKTVCKMIVYYGNRIWMKGENWIFIAITAVVTGFAATYIELCTRYLSDIRFGFCKGMPLQTRSVCCGGSAMIDFKTGNCLKSVKLPTSPDMTKVELAKWVNWSEILLLIRFTWSKRIVAYCLQYFLYVIISIVLTSLAVFLCQMFAPLAAGSGIPEVKIILSGFVLKGALSGWTGLIKIWGLSLGASSGLSLGKEGPLVQIACCCAIVLFNNLSINRNKERTHENTNKNDFSEIEQRDELLSAASACGVSVAFGAPLGGVLFSFEEISSRFPLRTLWKSFFGAVIGALVLKWINTTEHNSLTLFPMDSVSLLGTWNLIELIPFAFIGLLGAAVGRLFIRLNTYWHSHKYILAPKTFSNPFIEVIIVTALCNIINFPFILLKTPHSVLLQQIFHRCGVVPNNMPDIFEFCADRTHPEYSYSDYNLSFSIFFQLAYAILVRIFQTVLTFGLSLPAGIFFPSLMIGGLMGRFVGLITIQLNSTFQFIDCHKCIHPGVYAIVGAAATLSGVTGVTISVVVIMFELTGGLSYVVPFMVSVMVAKWSADVISKLSIYDYVLRLRGYPYMRHAMNDQMFVPKVCDVMASQLVAIAADAATIESLEEKIQH